MLIINQRQSERRLYLLEEVSLTVSYIATIEDLLFDGNSLYIWQRANNNNNNNNNNSYCYYTTATSPFPLHLLPHLRAS
jgi:hypothetical protein